MQEKEHSQSIVISLLGLVIIIVVIVASVSTLEGIRKNGSTYAQVIGTPTSGEGNTATSTSLETQTEPFSMVTKTIIISTIALITSTPWDTPVPMPTGTREGDRVKFSGEKLGLDALNGWAGLLDGNRVSIYAGALHWEPEQGAIVLFIILPYRNFKEQVLTPTKHGGVRVLGEQNNRLILQAFDGETFYFDVPARRFVASLTEIVQTATPPPTLTPFISSTGSPVPTYNPYPFPTVPGTEAP